MTIKKRYICALTLCASLTLSLAASAFDTATAGEKSSLSSGFDHIAILDCDGTLYSIADKNDILSTSVETVSVGVHKIAYVRSGGALYTYSTDGSGKTEKIADGVNAVSSGTTHTAIIKVDKSLWTFGANDRGQLGNGTRTNSDKPVKVMDNVKAVSAGGRYTLALKTDNSLWAFGVNTYGQLGDGSETTKERPVKIMEDVISFSAGYNHSLAVTSDGKLYAFGCNEFGQLGDRTTTNSSKPVKIMDNIKSASAGYHYSSAVDNDGALYTFGDNFYGQLGNEKKNSSAVDVSENRLAPELVMGNVASVTAGNKKTLVVLNNGLLYSFGGDSVKPVFAGFNVRNGSVPTEALPTASKMDVDGYVPDMDAYEIKGSNYVKIRDVATFLILSGKGFDVEYDKVSGNISLTQGKPYVMLGGEMQKSGTGPATAIPSNSKFFLNGKELSISIYQIGDSNYVKLRDMGELLNFGVTWKADTNTIEIRSFNSYESGVNK